MTVYIISFSNKLFLKDRMATNYLTLYNKPTYASDGTALPTTMVSLGPNVNQTYTNPQSGSYTTWQTAQTGLTNVNKIAMSQTGQYQIVSGNSAGGAAVFYLSSDSGATWTAITGIPTTVSTTGVSATISATGQYQLIAIQGDYVYKSLDYGVTWTAVNTSPTPQVYFAFDGATTDAQGGATSISTNTTATYVTGAVSSATSSGAFDLTANTMTLAPSQFLTGSYTFGANFTISFWFNATAAATGQICVIGLGAGGNFSYMYALGGSNTSFVQYLNSGGGYPTTNLVPITINQWNHVIVTYSLTGSCLYYLNGLLVASIAGGAFGSSPTTFRVGGYAHGSGAAFKGYVDDLRIYNSVITPPMVKYPWNSVSMSGSASHWLAANTFGQVYRTTDQGTTWTIHSAANTPASSTITPLQLSHSGQHQITNAPQKVIPNQTSLGTYSWINNGVTWIVSASTTYNNTAYAYYVFNNTQDTGWASYASTYSAGGVPVGGTTTTVQTIGTVSGDYLQLQTSTPLTLYSYRYASGGTVAFSPRAYTIAGSTDGVTWYPIHTISMASSPLGAANAAWKSSVIVNYTGTQSIVGQGTGATTVTATTTAYTTASASYTYFRFIFTQTAGSVVEVGELYPVFVGGQQYTANSGATWQVIPAFGDAFNVTKALTVTSAGAGYATLPSWTYAGTGVTFSAWFYLTAAAVQYGRIVDIGNSYNTPTNSLHLFINSNGTFSAGTMTNGTTQQPYLTSGTACAQNTLYHVCWTISAAGVQNFYLNGVADATSVTYVPVNGTYISNFVGKSNWANDGYPNEYIVDFRMFNRALSATEVATLYQANNFNLGPSSMEALSLSGNGKYAVGGAGQVVKVDSNYLAATLAGTQTVQTLPTTATIMCASASYTGQYMTVTTTGTSSNLWYSTNYGATWTSTTVGAAPLTSCAMSYDGSYITVTNATTVYTLNLNTKGYSVAVGSQAGQSNQGLNAVAIGTKAAQVNQTAGSIVLNATGSTVNTATQGFYVAPIQTYLNGMNGALAMLAYGSDKQVVTADVYFLSQPGANYVGIGTASPTYKLDVQNGDISLYTNYIGYQAAGTLSHMIRFRRSVHSMYTDIVYGDTARIYTLRDYNAQVPGGDTLVLTTRYPTWGNETWNTGLCINSYGNVGIGLTNPAYLLSVAGHSQVINTTNDVMGLFSPNYGAFIHIGAWNAQGSTSKNLVLNYLGGNVGIGSSTPAYPLDVNGVTRTIGVINTGAATYFGYNTPTVYISSGSSNGSSMYANAYNYLQFSSVTQTPSNFITTTTGKHAVLYTGIYTICFTLGTGGANNIICEMFISKNQFNNSTDLNAPGYTLAAGYLAPTYYQNCISWTGALTAGDFICVGYYYGNGGTGTVGPRSSISITLVHRTG